jgi:hypothetical protein
VGVWRSVGARFIRIEEVAGSTPATSTKWASGLLGVVVAFARRETAEFEALEVHQSCYNAAREDVATLKLLGELVLLFGVGIKLQKWQDRREERLRLLYKSRGLGELK